MSTVHIANTDFEFELAQTAPLPIADSWASHPLCLQLQFLPLLYAKPEDAVAVTAFPEQGFLEELQAFLKSPLPNLISLTERKAFPNAECLSWGPSLQVKAWAKSRNLAYNIPDNWAMIQDINSKAFSMRYSPLDSRLITSPVELKHFMNEVSGPKVLKTCFGLSGLGHLIINETTNPGKVAMFCAKEFMAGRAIIGEPWLKRIFDFSTQWFLTKEGKAELLGSTVFETDAGGAYQGTLAGPEEEIFHTHLPYLEEHKKRVMDLLQELHQLGNFGHVGVDALLYDDNETTKLYPIVEINGRQTLSWVALRLQQLKFPDKVIRLTFKKGEEGLISLLPAQIISQDGKKTPFSRQLVMELIA